MAQQDAASWPETILPFPNSAALISQTPFAVSTSPSRPEVHGDWNGHLQEKCEDKQNTRKGKIKRNEVDLFVFLSDDILEDILKRLPDACLGYQAKYVCRRWFDLIISKGMLADDKNASFIIQGLLRTCHVGIKEEGEEGLQVKVQYLDIPQMIMVGTIRSWSNEFLLIKVKGKLYVYNLLTKEGSYLPQCSNASCGRDCYAKCGVAISFDMFIGKHKVVHLFPGPPIECHVLILREDTGSSKWKKILVPCMNVGRFFSHKPVSVQGRYIHWGTYDDKKHMIFMDMVKEEIFDMSLSSLPILGDGSRRLIFYKIFEMGGSLALFVAFSEYKAQIWILKDFQRNKWKKLHSFTLKNNYYHRTPALGVISSNKYIMLESTYDENMWYYDMKKRAVKKLGMMDLELNRDVRGAIWDGFKGKPRSKPLISVYGFQNP